MLIVFCISVCQLAHLLNANSNQLKNVSLLVPTVLSSTVIPTNVLAYVQSIPQPMYNYMGTTLQPQVSTPASKMSTALMDTTQMITSVYA